MVAEVIGLAENVPQQGPFGDHFVGGELVQLDAGGTEYLGGEAVDLILYSILLIGEVFVEFEVHIADRLSCSGSTRR